MKTQKEIRRELKRIKLLFHSLAQKEGITLLTQRLAAKIDALEWVLSEKP